MMAQGSWLLKSVFYYLWYFSGGRYESYWYPFMIFLSFSNYFLMLFSQIKSVKCETELYCLQSASYQTPFHMPSSS